MSSQSPPVAYTLQSEWPILRRVRVPIPEQWRAVISASNLPIRRFKLISEQRNVFVKARVEACSVHTKACMCTTSAEWKQTFQMSAAHTFFATSKRRAELYVIYSEARTRSSVVSLQLFASTLRGTSLKSTAEITVGDLLQRCLYEQGNTCMPALMASLYLTDFFSFADAELDLRDLKFGLRGRIKIRLSLSSNGSLIVSEARRLALVLSRQPNADMAATGGYIDDIESLLAISVPTPPAMAAQSILHVLDRLDHFMRIADEAAKVWFPPENTSDVSGAIGSFHDQVHPYARLAWDLLSAAHKV